MKSEKKRRKKMRVKDKTRQVKTGKKKKNGGKKGEKKKGRKGSKGGSIALIPHLSIDYDYDCALLIMLPGMHLLNAMLPL